MDTKKHPNPGLWTLLLLLVFIAGLGIRLYDLTDPPLDFHPTRQLFSALKARGFYYQYNEIAPDWQREMAARQLSALQTIEPPILETIVAHSYRVTGEHVWIARVYSSLFWVLGGIALYFLAVGLFASRAAALTGTLIYLFNPYGVIASRSFQPDPLMVMLLLIGALGLWRWQQSSGWGWAWLGGLAAGLAILVKNVAVFPVLAVFLVLTVIARGFRRSLRNPQAWAAGALIVIPAAAYTLYGLWSGFLGEQFSSRFFPAMWLDPGFYLSLAVKIDSVVGIELFVLSLVGCLLASSSLPRRLLLALWGSYLLYGLTFPYHFSTHDYYQLPLIPIVALSIAPLVKLVIFRLGNQQPFWLYNFIPVVLVILSVGFFAWQARSVLKKHDYRPQAHMWTELGELFGHDAAVVSLTEDYGYALSYWGWQNSQNWLASGDINLRERSGQSVDVPALFNEAISGKQFFLVTDFADLDHQEEIKTLLFESFPIYAEGEGYLIFDLRMER